MLLVGGISFLTYSFISKDEAIKVQRVTCNCPPGYAAPIQVTVWQNTTNPTPPGTVIQSATFRCTNGPDFDVLIVCYRTIPTLLPPLPPEAR